MESTADKIVAEVKSQGVFDQFRRDSIAQVDTKPAYINLIQRVQSTVNKFLSSKVWGPEMNKIQMRERLRRHITDSSFLELGIERIVDQVVNPKIATTFQPQIEKIAYGTLGIEKPKVKEEDKKSFQDFSSSMSLVIPNGNLMPEELEQISPDSDKMTIKSESKGSDSMDTSDDKTEDFESPEFEPIENNSNDNLEAEKKPEIKLEDKLEIKTENEKNEVTQESNLSQVSSLLSIISESEDTNLHASISENAQMPKFNENSNSFTEASTKTSNFTELAFNIKKDEIKFEGTERKMNFSEEKLEEIVKTEEECKIKEEPKIKIEKNEAESLSIDEISTPKMHKEKSRDHSSSSSHKKSSSKDKDKDTRDKKYERSDKDKDRKSSSSSSSKKHSSSSSKDKHSSSSKHKSKYSDKNYSSSSKDKHHSKNDKCSTKPSVFRRKSTDSNDDNAGSEKKTTNSVTSNGNHQKENNLSEVNKQGNSTNDSTTSPSDSVGIPIDEETLYYFEAPELPPLDEDFEYELYKQLKFIKIQLPTDDSTSFSSQDSSTSFLCSHKRKLETEDSVTETKATLIIDCVDYSNYEYAHKKFKSSLNKVSPTPSELSVGSKENVASGTAPRKPIDRKSMESNQRYSTEDLYKPRPILSQRSRRRGIDTNVL